MKRSAHSVVSHGPLPRPRTARGSFLCAECRMRAARAAPIAPFHSAPLRNAPKPRRDQEDDEDAKDQDPFLERLRRKVWKTETPFGQKDPYAREGAGTEQLPVPKELKPDAPEPPEPPPLTPTVASEAYVPASTWDGLDRIGGASGWWEEQWDAEHPFHGFAPVKRTSPEETRRLIRSLLVNVMVMRQAGINFSRAARVPADTIDYSMVKFGWSKATQARVWFPDDAMQDEIINMSLSDLHDQPQATLDRSDVEEPDSSHEPLAPQAHDDGVAPTPDSGVVGETEQIRAKLAGKTGEDGLSESQLGPSTATANDAEGRGTLQEPPVQFNSPISSRDSEAPDILVSEPISPDSHIFSNDSWLRIPIQGLRFKFFFLKHVTQLTGFRFPDYAIAGIATVKDVVVLAEEKPKPKKLAEMLLQNPTIAALPNVEVFDRRQTPIDKEKEVGRWKIIEQELREKGLPVTGNR